MTERVDGAPRAPRLPLPHPPHLPPSGLPSWPYRPPFPFIDK